MERVVDDDDRRLGAQIDYIVYSCDFPWRIELQSVMPGAAFSPPFDGPASITGATYLAIVRAVAEAHGGSVACTHYGPPEVSFELKLPSA